MRYRWKLLILLLAISMVPVMAGRTFGVHAFRKLGDTLISQSRKKSTAQMKSHLKLLVDSYASYLWIGRENLETLLMYQAREVEHLLEKDHNGEHKAYFVDDFKKSKNLPPGLTTSSIHFRSAATDKMELMEVSYSEPVFKLAEGVQKDDVALDISRLAAIGSIYKKLSRRFHGLVTWQYTSLANGVHTAYPGHGYFPEEYDHRKQPWYKEALIENRKSPPWSEPYVDQATRQLVMAATMPVKGPDGEIVGVTAIVAPISSLLVRRLLIKNTPPETRSFMGFLVKGTKTDDRKIHVVASDSHTEFEYRKWETPIKAEWLTSDNKTQFQAMLDDLEAENSNMRRMPYEGRDSLWVYGRLNVNAFLVLITPYEEILESAVQAEEYIQTLIDQLIYITRYVMFGIALLVFVLAFAFSRTVSQPLQALVDGSRSLAQGNFDARVDIRSRDEFGEMGRVFNNLGPLLEEHFKMRRSLDLAMEVQQNLLPKFDPKIEGLDISGESIYCDETGGDYYDFLDMDAFGQRRIGIVVGDVSDHGIPSALLMTTARAFIRQRSSMPGNLSQVVSDVNFQLSRDIEESGQFMTLFLAEIDLNAMIIRWVRAGHDPALVYDAHTDSFEELSGRGLPLGVFEDSDYEESVRKIKPGQIIAIGTDGIWETHNAEGEMFGKQILKEIIRDHAEKPAKEIFEEIIDALEHFRRPLEQEDDVTLVVIKVERSQY